MGITVYGASDDLIEIEGDIREEFNVIDADGYLAFSNGLLMSIRYDKDGVWRIALVRSGDLRTDDFKLTQAPANDEENYSDRLEVYGNIEWVMFGEQFAS